MIYTSLTKKAMSLCFEAHKEQKDKSGLPYVFHPFYVAEQMETEEETIVALLHDMVEDTDWSLEALAAEGFGEEVIRALALLTHEKNVNYKQYVRAIKQNPLAKAVKLADLRHNSDLSRLNVIDEKARKRYEQYVEAIAILTEE